MKQVNQAIVVPHGIWRFCYLPLLMGVILVASSSPALARGQQTTGCATPDPFVTLGGGMWVNGGWLPPGMEPVVTPALPPATPPPVAGNCATPDPFGTLGGGTCVNGGWLPPGMVPVVTPTPPPPPAPTPGGCTTPDPFNIPGMVGLCVNGGWIPTLVMHVSFQVSGLVQSTDGDPLDGVLVTASTGESTITDQSGAYTLSGTASVPSNEASFRVGLQLAKDGYETASDYRVFPTVGSPKGWLYKQLQPFVRLLAGDTLTGVLASLQVASCWPCKVIHVVSPSAGTLELRLKWSDPASPLSLWLASPFTELDPDPLDLTEVIATVQVEGGETVLLLGCGDAPWDDPCDQPSFQLTTTFMPAANIASSPERQLLRPRP